jgi:predicted lysophospholipase L1 biosynthesis ABC-type transport system permease subunit
MDSMKDFLFLVGIALILAVIATALTTCNYLQTHNSVECVKAGGTTISHGGESICVKAEAK